MQGTPAPVFGKRNRPESRTARPSPGLLPDPHRAFFAAARAESEDPVDRLSTGTVPRSLRAAVLAGIVVACGLAGLDATAKIADLRGVVALLPGQTGGALLVPALILVAVLGGGRAAATSLIVAHGALSRVGQRSHLAYALGGATAAGLFSVAFALVGVGSSHGLAIDVLAGGAGGFFYRVFAGTRAGGPRT